jgi:hypothetical protein
VGTFPPEASSRAQYCPQLRAFAVYLVEQQLVPYARVQEPLRDLIGADLLGGRLVGGGTPTRKGTACRRVRLKGIGNPCRERSRQRERARCAPWRDVGDPGARKQQVRTRWEAVADGATG